MTPNEFKAWFDGFTEAFEGSPTKKQWERIKSRVAEIDGKSVTERVYLDRYLPSYPALYPYRTYPWAYVSQTLGSTIPVNVSNCQGSAIGSGGLSSNFNSLHAMNALGRNDAQSLAG